MIAHPESDWQTRRNHFNHDWLKNCFLLALGRFINILDDRIVDEEFERRFVASGLADWEGQYRAVVELIDSFETKMSPKVLFDRLPMSRWPKEKTWLPTVVHEMWRNRVNARELVAGARHRAEQANAAYLKVKLSLGEDSGKLSAAEFRERRDLFAQFRDDCRALAKAVEQFPSRILVS